MAVDKITLEVLNNFTHAAVESMAYTLIRTAYTTFIKETQDFSTALVTCEGEVFAFPKNMAATWQLATHMGEAIRVINEYREGDIIISNDPYSSKYFVTHTPDFHLWKPVFYEGKIVCFAACHVHNTDAGGAYPATVSRRNNEVFQEGIRIPPQKLYREGVLNEDLVETIKWNVRVPDQNWGDLKAQIACVNTGEKMVHDMIRRFGIETFRTGIYALLDYAEERARSVICGIQDGEYSFCDYLDDDVVSDMPVRFAMKMKVKGDEIVLDFTGSDPQLNCAMNIPTGGREKHGLPAVGLFHYFMTVDPMIPINGAVMRPITLVMPKGTVMNPEYPAAVGMRTAPMPRIADVIFGCLAKAGAAKVPACPSGHATIIVISIQNPKTGKRHVSSLEPMLGGGGGCALHDGSDVAGGILTFLCNTPVEINEAEVPIMVRRYELIPDSGGAGKYRGGLGVRFDFQVFQPNVVITARNRERGKFRPWGLKGGKPAVASRFILNPGLANEKDLGDTDVVTLEPGDIVSTSTPGGGGYGCPFERDLRAVLKDVQSGYVSAAAAERDYGVVIREGRCDQTATERLRAELKRVVVPTDFDFGPERTKYESVWSETIYDVFLDLLMKMPIPLRMFAKKEIFEAVEADAGQGRIPQRDDILETWNLIKMKYGLESEA